MILSIVFCAQVWRCRDFPQLGAEAAVVVYRQADPIASDPSGVEALVTELQDAPGAAAVVDRQYRLMKSLMAIVIEGKFTSRRNGCALQNIT